MFSTLLQAFILNLDEFVKDDYKAPVPEIMRDLIPLPRDPTNVVLGYCTPRVWEEEYINNNKLKYIQLHDDTLLVHGEYKYNITSVSINDLSLNLSIIGSYWLGDYVYIYGKKIKLKSERGLTMSWADEDIMFVKNKTQHLMIRTDKRTMIEIQ